MPDAVDEVRVFVVKNKKNEAEGGHSAQKRADNECAESFVDRVEKDPRQR